MTRPDKHAARFGKAYTERFRYQKPGTISLIITPDFRRLREAFQRAIAAFQPMMDWAERNPKAMERIRQMQRRGR